MLWRKSVFWLERVRVHIYVRLSGWIIFSQSNYEIIMSKLKMVGYILYDRTELMDQSIFRTYNYIIIGSEYVGKTNLIARIIRDEFIEVEKLSFEGEQSIIFTLDGCSFKLVFQERKIYEAASVVANLKSQDVHGLIFMFALNNSDSFNDIEKLTRNYVTTIQPDLELKNIRIPHILIGNKSDLNYSPIRQSIYGSKEVQRLTQFKNFQNNYQKSFCIEATQLANNLQMKYYQISFKKSKKEVIQEIFVEMINQNEINRFILKDKKKSKGIQSFFCTQKDNNRCSII